MRDHAFIYLMYHELEVKARKLCQAESGYVRYVVRELDFREQMDWLKQGGIYGLSVSDALDNKIAGGIVITFDDGCETDLTVAAPILLESKFGATFYITLGFLGRPGYMVPRQVRELSDAGFDIGCHSMTHPYLSDLKDSDLTREIAGAKNQLEEIIGRPVHHFSCPGGRWDPRISDVARRAGYRSVATSRIAVNRPQDDPFQLARIPVMRGGTLAAFQQVCLGHGLRRKQLREFLQTTTHRVLGNTLYDRLRSYVLERNS